MYSTRSLQHPESECFFVALSFWLWFITIFGVVVVVLENCSQCSAGHQTQDFYMHRMCSTLGILNLNVHIVNLEGTDIYRIKSHAHQRTVFQSYDHLIP